MQERQEQFVAVATDEFAAEPILDAVYFGPFDTVDAAQKCLRDYRESKNLPCGNIEPTPEECEAWSEAGWVFGIFPMRDGA